MPALFNSVTQKKRWCGKKCFCVQ